MTTTRRFAGAATLLSAALLGLSACGGGGSSAESGGEPATGETAAETGGGSEETTSGATGTIDSSLSIEEITTLNLEDELEVRGYVVDAGGETRLCTSAEGSPPACGAPSLRLVGYEGDVPSNGEIVVLGNVVGRTVTVE